MISFFFKGEKEKYDSRNHILEDTDKDKLRLLGAIINSGFFTERCDGSRCGNTLLSLLHCLKYK